MRFSIDQSAWSSLRTAALLMPKKVRSATKSAFKSAAFFLRGELRDSVATNKLGWDMHQAYTKTTFDMTQVLRANKPIQTAKTKTKGGAQKKSYNAALRSIKSGPAPMFGKLRNIFRYIVDAPSSGDPYAVIGVLGKYASPKAEKITQEFQTGGEIDPFERFGATDSESVRRYFGALGMPIKSNTPGEGFKFKARPLFGPVMQQQQDKVNAQIADKILTKIADEFFKDYQ